MEHYSEELARGGTTAVALERWPGRGQAGGTEVLRGGIHVVRHARNGWTIETAGGAGRGLGQPLGVESL